MEGKALYLETFGCQMNVLDSERVVGSMAGQGYHTVSRPEDAEIILYNTCSVRDHAEEKVRSRLGSLGRLKKRRPEIVIGVLGCMAQREAAEMLGRWPHLDLVCGTRQLHRVPDLVRGVLQDRRRIVSTEMIPDFPGDDLPRPPGQGPLAYVSVMRGCDNVCSFCVVPRTRGREISRPLPSVVEEVRALVEGGVREVTLLGQNINSYGKGLAEERDLADLLGALDPLDGLERVRFVTSNPWDMTDRLLDAMGRLETACEYLHFPAQSGSDRILAAMRRDYTVHDYLRLVEDARSRVPGIELATDIIVGYPGEDDEDFEGTLRLLKEVEFHTAYIFKYSPRPGTTAALLEDSVPTALKKERNQVLLAAQDEIALKKRKGMIGRTEEVLVEGPSRRDPRVLTGRTRQNYIVHFPPDGAVPGDLREIAIEDATARALRGRSVP